MGTETDDDNYFDETPKAEIVPVDPSRILSREEKDALKIREIEDDLHARSMTITNDAMRFGEINEDAEEPPEHWIEELGPEGALRRFRVAKAAWMPLKNSPAGLAIAGKVFTGIVKARATEKSGPKSLSITMVQMNAPQSFPEIEVDSDPERR